MSEAREPANKKLRSSEPDLVVTVGVGDEQKEYHYHSPVMATHSKFIDATLATPMRESQTGRINFPDLSAEVWESMIYFLDPSTSRQMTVQDALQVVAAYDKYDFCAGAKCCDQVFSAFFRALMPRSHREGMKQPADLNQLIDVFVIADAANLKQTKKFACRYFRDALGWALCNGEVIFGENQIKNLVPLIVKNKLLSRSSFTKDEILQSLFPKLFVTSVKYTKTIQILERDLVGLELHGAGDEVDGEFTAIDPITRFEMEEPVSWGDVDQLFIRIGLLDGDWVIYGEIDTDDGYDTYETIVLWKNPSSEDMPLPPESGWVPVDRLATGEPTIGYLYENNYP